MKNPLTTAGIEPATFRFVAQHLSHCATAVPVLKGRFCNFLHTDNQDMFLHQNGNSVVLISPWRWLKLAETCSKIHYIKYNFAITVLWLQWGELIRESETAVQSLCASYKLLASSHCEARQEFCYIKLLTAALRHVMRILELLQAEQNCAVLGYCAAGSGNSYRRCGTTYWSQVQRSIPWRREGYILPKRR